MLIGFDTETFYTHTYSIKRLTKYHYTHNPQFDCYLISVYSPNIKFVGKPSEFDWESIRGCEFVCHNAVFDKAIYNRMVELGQIPDIKPVAWHCSANLAAYTYGVRNLKDAANVMLGESISKTIRDNMKGFTYSDLEENSKKAIDLQEIIDNPKRTVKQKQMAKKRLDNLATLEAVKIYALKDAELTYTLWDRFGHLWTPFEEKRANLNEVQSERGIFVDKPLLEKSLEKVIKFKQLAKNRLPWVKDGKPPQSEKVIREYCAKENIEAPRSFNKTKQDYQEWLDKFKYKFKWVKGLETYKKLHKLHNELLTIQNAIRPDGKVGFELMYFGAGATGRDSGRLFNLQNMKKLSEYGVNIRHIFIPSPGKKFVLADYAQIEARIIYWKAKDEETLKLMRSGMSVYESYARRYMGWSKGDLKKEDPKQYGLAKATVLSGIYLVGHVKRITMVPTYGIKPETIFNDPVNSRDFGRFQEWCLKWNKRAWAQYLAEEDHKKIWHPNSWMQVQDFRYKNEKIKFHLWDNYKNMIPSHVGRDLKIELPSGRSLVYRDVKQEGTEFTAVVKGKRKKIYNGLMTENTGQSIATDVCKWNVLKCEEKGIQSLMNEHDGFLFEVDKDFDINIIKNILKSEVEWAQGLPLDIEIEECNHFKK